LEVPFFNIALTGQIGAGKSSFFNSVNSIFNERVIGSKANVGSAARSLTSKVKRNTPTPQTSTQIKIQHLY
jgi:dephospho-CoA kinase